MSVSSAPVIETTRLRLRLRAHTREDFANTAALWADPLVTHHISGRAFTPEECWSRLLRYVGHWALMGFGYWVVEEQGGAFVGEVGFANYQREIEPPLGDAPEIGWVLASSMHGKGYASEAAAAALAWSDMHLAARETVCIIAPENLASQRVAAKLAYRETRRAIYKERETIVFSRERKT